MGLKFGVTDTKKLRVIVDTDAACEADDPFAIAHALMSPKLIVKGITAEHFNVEGWEKAFESSNTDIGFYTTRERSLDEVLPWHIVDCSVSDRYLLNEYKKAMAETTTHDCRHGCTGCGMNQRAECRLGGIYE